MKLLNVCKFGAMSRGHLSSCAEPLILLAENTIAVVPPAFDFSVICGHRGQEAQERAFAEGNSKKRWGESAHNVFPSRAFDFMPYPFRGWKGEERDRFLLIRGHIYLVASQMGIRIKPTISWDAGHIELV